MGPQFLPVARPWNGVTNLTNKNSCGAEPPHNAGLNKPVESIRALGFSM